MNDQTAKAREVSLESKSPIHAIMNELCIGDEFLWTPERLVPLHHWAGHIPFAFWLMSNMRPRRFVELGTHKGNSYCAFCQAAERLRIDLTATAVDTWQGDVHMAREAGLFEELSSYHDPKYGHFSTLLRSTFDDAKPYFSDGSIDLLHIDGTHTYDAVKNDFETWLPSLSDRAVVLFHDIEVRRDDFGVWKLWEELKGKYPSFTFTHSYGLGVLAVGKYQNNALDRLFCIDKDPVIAPIVREIFSSRGSIFTNILLVDNVRTEYGNLSREALEMRESLESRISVLSDQNEDLRHILRTDRLKLRDERSKNNRNALVLHEETVRRMEYQRISNEMLSSTSWHLTAPVRKIIERSPRIRRLARQSIKAVWWTLTGQLRVRLKARKEFLNSRKTAPGSDHRLAQIKTSPVPFYVDPNAREKISQPLKIGVHVHAYYEDVFIEILYRLKNIDSNFDLFVSVPETATWLNRQALEEKIRDILIAVQNVQIKLVPNRGRDISPFIIEFGELLIEYDIVGHFHTKKSPHDSKLKHWRTMLFDCLLGTLDGGPWHLNALLNRLATDAKFIAPQRLPHFVLHFDGWSGNKEIAAKILEKHSNISIDSLSEINFPEGMMFWGTSDALRPFLTLALKYDDFSKEPIASDGTFAHALERLVFALSPQNGRSILQVNRADYAENASFYESQEDYSASILHKDVKVLSYYLPQFHPIPENDEWHGTGFTEWTKVRAANPLFKGHYQQHVPHEHIGYYIIHDATVLEKQADMMKKAGVYGQIFYHYWFSGKLILEGPSKILLENKNIDMPFCFCWANENWTKRWDGSENEILLEQIYSASDARAFIQYLIPFFQDHRYIKIDGRPVLHIYRPKSILNIDEYLAIWEEECDNVGLPKPYVVATLAAGASSPNEFGLDAGAERVLYDWTNGAVPEITGKVDPYYELTGRVFSYEEISSFYKSQNHKDDFDRFPSIVPDWDNTARYQNRAHVLHGSTPEKFQSWMEALIQRAKSTLPVDSRFILVNAWNEWAEGAHLEPDIRSGFAYLNCVGRALSNIAYAKSGHPVYGMRPLEIVQNRAKQAGSILLVSHSWGGGTERHINDMIDLLRKQDIVLLAMRVDPHDGARFIIDEVLVDDTEEIASFSIHDDPSILSNILGKLSTRLVHVHHLIDLPKGTADWLMLACAGANVSYDVTLHDYFSVCPQVHLVGPDGQYCGEPDESTCNVCLTSTSNPHSGSIERWRRTSRRFLSGARRRYVPDGDVGERLKRYFPEMDFVVRPHPERTMTANATGRISTVVERHYVVVGHIGSHKGSNVIYDCAKHARDNAIPLRFTILGTTDITPKLNELGNVAVLGAFNKSDLNDLMISLNTPLAFIPSVIPETYSYVLTEIVSSGLYPVAFDIGAIASRIKAMGWGQVLSNDLKKNPVDLVNALMEITLQEGSSSMKGVVCGQSYDNVLHTYYELD
ncbi:glycoside hydrolase family 99-like domain-containing protein [Brucella anthropi]|uniref:glycoside hydrolase family 99-like domain-containing protein n=1 Tax=Brucella anthropi TaxID=529 RepID=UPI001E63F21B|nr:glycoside hydrolase family 99-like domain-containing protein [Brucella anthropi]UGQ22210.1 glycoside hydrolase family 99-like domain-containing protein [Brucella anthropi]